MFKNSVTTLVFVSALFAGLSANASVKEYRYQQMVKNSLLDKAPPLKITAGTFDQKLDPSDPSNGQTFKQRTFIDSEFATDNAAPIFYVMCGEGSCDNGGFFPSVVAQARQFGARLVALEHRYYGQSQPFAHLSAANLKYLSTENALADLAAFQKYLMQTTGWTGPWITVGGSYSGSLSAYYRLKNPNLVQGALASSGPVEAKAAFSEYDAAVAEAAGPQCTAAILGVVKQVQDSMSDPAALAKMKALFNASDVNDNVDFLYVLADMAAMAVQYGNKDAFCSAVTGSDPLGNYAKVGLQLFTAFGITPLQDSMQGIESDDVKLYETGVGERQWFWQSCTEYGYFQVANSDPKMTARSPLIDLNYHYQACQRLFGLANPVNTDKINRGYYVPLQISALSSKIFFTNGSTDPWRMLSINSERGNNHNPNNTYQMIDGGSHCSDLDSSTLQPIMQAQTEFVNLVKSWLSL